VGSLGMGSVGSLWRVMGARVPARIHSRLKPVPPDAESSPMTGSERALRRALHLALAVTAFAAFLPLGAAEAAAPDAPNFGPLIENYAEYDGQTKCKPKPKPGVLAFRKKVLATYPSTGDAGIGRACSIGGQSEHKEGRAWDWAVDGTTRAGRRTAKQLFEWLFATDRHGNRHAHFRRLGLMYVQWRRRIWGSWDPGWERYCVATPRGCRDTDSKAILNPHLDHAHFSFGWPGARKLTSFWNPELSRP
jgi:hypothetical protein